ncbi:DUF1294 domain-containing protein [Qipengyuania zhejiangensis]|uniref:DUF1294 domain-containing protein n=1 Tax=Qipengyuania zhejiangensis TaxID=3077782 RepID=UPI002D76AAA4|nr:DUF1294 domain-containing protein [Qipengyuania sp. Z2]
MLLAELATYFLIAINFLAFAAFGWDKAQAESGGWRVTEKTLVTLASLGGIFGALAGRAVFRHKTRKPGFNAKLWAGALNSLVVAGFCYFLFMSVPGPRSPEDEAQMETVMASVQYSGCDEVRAAGKAPLHYGQPGYRAEMDGDGDGLACEPIR